MYGPDSPPVATRAGTVALVGRPNAGKSTLLNAFVGEKLSIVTPKAQTTWRRVVGIHTSERAQMIFVDTPGLLDVRDLLQRAMLQEAREAIRDADVVLLVVDVTRSLAESATPVVRDALAGATAPLFTVLNKADLVTPTKLSEIGAAADRELPGRTFVVSAAHGTGVRPLREALERALPLSPFLYDREDIASQPVRFFVTELVRETVFEQFTEEIPYSIFCAVEEFREREDPVYIRVTLFAERDSQKQILIGEGGRAIRRLGSAARAKVEHLIGRPVYLDLWVKALPGWRRKRGHLARFGFRLPEDDERASRAR
jgi:GTP-binding protein Era